MEKIEPTRKPESSIQARVQPYFWRLDFHPGFLKVRFKEEEKFLTKELPSPN
jgi:hypothetical protein